MLLEECSPEECSSLRPGRERNPEMVDGRCRVRTGVGKDGQVG
jgi:hypothetical protein